MPFKRKIPNDREELASHIRAGIDEEGMAEIYGVCFRAMRRELIRHGLVYARTRAVQLEEAFARERPVEPRNGEIILLPHKTTFMREFHVQGKGFEVRPLSLPAISMQRALLASNLKAAGGRHA